MTSPQQQLADLVSGTISSPNTIDVGPLAIQTFGSGVVRVIGHSDRGVVIGLISDGPDVLAEEFLALAREVTC